MRRLMRPRRHGARMTALALVAAMPATPALAGESVAITLTGRVEQSCEISPPGRMALGDVSKAGSAETSFGFSCNAPFKVTLESRRGGLALSQPVPAIGNFGDRAKYSIDAMFPYDSGGHGAIAGCASDRLEARRGESGCGSIFTGDRTAINQTAKLKLSWQEAAKPLLAGDYEDVLTLRIASQL